MPASEWTCQKLNELLTQGVAEGDARSELNTLQRPSRNWPRTTDYAPLYLDHSPATCYGIIRRPCGYFADIGNQFLQRPRPGRGATQRTRRNACLTRMTSTV